MPHPVPSLNATTAANPMEGTSPSEGGGSTGPGSASNSLRQQDSFGTGDGGTGEAEADNEYEGMEINQ